MYLIGTFILLITKLRQCLSNLSFDFIVSIWMFLFGVHWSTLTCLILISSDPIILTRIAYRLSISYVLTLMTCTMYWFGSTNTSSLLSFFSLAYQFVCIVILYFSFLMVIYRCLNYLLIGFMLPILVAMRNLAFWLITKLKICGSNFFHLNVYCHLVVR